MRSTDPRISNCTVRVATLVVCWCIGRGELVTLRNQLRDVERQIGSLLDRIVDANSASVVSAYESRIERLEREKIVLNERLETTIPPKGRQEDCIEHTLGFLANPWNIYKNGDHAMRQLVLRLAFSKPLRYSQNGLYGAPEFSFPFKYLAGNLGSKSEMVQLEGDKLNSLFENLEEWNQHLKHTNIEVLQEPKPSHQSRSIRNRTRGPSPC